MSPRAAALSPEELASRLVSLPTWSVADNRLHREFRFADFSEAFAFMTRVALESDKLDQHPDWSNSWNLVIIDITSHDAGGITDTCFALASAIDGFIAD